MPEVFEHLRTRNRNAWLFPYCFSTKTTPETVEFDGAGLFGGIINSATDKGDDYVDKPADGMPKTYLKNAGLDRRTFKTQCFPLTSIMKAISQTKIDFLGLDIEGTELQVLRTIPWKDLDIRVVGIEVNHIGQVFQGSLHEMRAFMAENGYHLYQTVYIDEIYVKTEFLKQLAKNAI